MRQRLPVLASVTFFNESTGGTYLITIVNGATLGASPHTLGGQVNINPGSSSQNEFVLALSGGGTITRDDLKEDYPGYTGDAISVHLKPKGNGNQNGLIVDGEPYELLNKNTYDVVSPYLTVNLYNDNVSAGKAMGQWWISISATCAEVTISE